METYPPDSLVKPPFPMEIYTEFCINFFINPLINADLLIYLSSKNFQSSSSMVIFNFFFIYLYRILCFLNLFIQNSLYFYINFDAKYIYKSPLPIKEKSEGKTFRRGSLIFLEKKRWLTSRF